MFSNNSVATSGVLTRFKWTYLLFNGLIFRIKQTPPLNSNQKRAALYGIPGLRQEPKPTKVTHWSRPITGQSSADNSWTGLCSAPCGSMSAEQYRNHQQNLYEPEKQHLTFSTWNSATWCSIKNKQHCDRMAIADDITTCTTGWVTPLHTHTLLKNKIHGNV